MKNNVTVFHDASGNPIQVLLSWVEYQKLINPEKPGKSLETNDPNRIRLPGTNGLMALDVQALVENLHVLGAVVIPINCKAQALDAFGENENVTLEVVVRCMLGQESPYKNTMQCTNALVDALVETGRFERCRAKSAKLQINHSCPYPLKQFYRPVHCLRIVG